MRLSRITVATLVAASALALTACDPDSSTGSAAPAPASAAPSGAAPAAGSPAASNSAKPGTSSGKPGEGGAKASKPAADCTANAAGVGPVVEATENGYQTHIWFKAKSTKFVCGPDVPNDGHFEAVGEPKVYNVANETKTLLLDENLKAKEVDVFVFMKTQEACLQGKQPAAPYRCFGSQYAVKLDSKGALLSVTQLYRP